MTSLGNAVCPFTSSARPLDDHDSDRLAMRQAGPLVELDAPAGGPVWVVTDNALAREVLSDVRFAKDPALAPSGWDRRSAGLEPTAAEQLSLTTLDGADHAALRRTFAPLFSARKMHDSYGRMVDVARDLLGQVPSGEVDLVADFSTRYPLTILCDLLGIPASHVDEAIEACRLMHVDYPMNVGRAMGGFAALASTALNTPGGLAQSLAARMPEGTSQGDLEYQIFTLLFAGQLTTDPSIGFLVARLLGSSGAVPLPDLVRTVLAEHPPAPFSLWRFTAEEVSLAGVSLPAHTPVLVDIQGINETVPDGEPDLTFGAGPHFCIGAQLAQLELQALAEVLSTEYPDARLALPYNDLRHATPGGIMGSRLLSLPVSLTS